MVVTGAPLQPLVKETKGRGEDRSGLDTELLSLSESSGGNIAWPPVARPECGASRLDY